MKFSDFVVTTAVMMEGMLLPRLLNPAETDDSATERDTDNEFYDGFEFETDQALDELEMYESEVRSKNLRDEGALQVLTSEQVTMLPGNYGDPLNAVKNFPGTARVTGLGGGIIIRGSNPEDTLYLNNGAPIPMMYHFGDVASIVSASLIRETEFYPGNFPVRYGRTTSGALNLTTRAPRTEGFRAVVDADLYDAGVLVEGAVTSDWSLALTGRRSYIDGVLKATGLLEDELRFSTAPRYYDFQAVADYHPSADNTVRISLLGADDKIASGVNFYTTKPLNLHASMYRIQAEGANRLGTGIRNEWQVGVSY